MTPIDGRKDADPGAGSGANPDGSTGSESGNDESESRDTESEAVGDESESVAAGSEPADAFAALSDPLRVDILEALAAHNREAGPGEPIGFADLRRRVDVRDSGRFRYHLRELQDRFVERTDDGYRLTNVGMEVVAAVIAGTYTDDPSLGPTALDSECPSCDAAVLAAYEDGFCRVACDDGHLLFGWRLPPNAAADADVETVVERAEMLAGHAIERAQAGVCPYCYGAIEPTLVTDADEPVVPDAEPLDVRFRAVCDTCGARMSAPLGFCLQVDPEVAAFYRRHGRTLQSLHMWEPGIARDESAATVVGEDPLRVEFEVRFDDDAVTATVDGRGRVVSVTDREA